MAISTIEGIQAAVTTAMGTAAQLEFGVKGTLCVAAIVAATWVGRAVASARAFIGVGLVTVTALAFGYVTYSKTLGRLDNIAVVLADPNYTASWKGAQVEIATPEGAHDHLSTNEIVLLTSAFAAFDHQREFQKVIGAVPPATRREHHLE